MEPSVNGELVNPTTDTPAPDEEPAGRWARRNLLNIAIGLALLVAVFRYLNPLDVLLAAVGLTAIIFLHELGHFLAAKFCNVRVDTFSIGFGPAIPGCHFRYGETTYKLAVIPLGGFVKMKGQEDGVVDAEPDDDPRSYKNQTVPERMLIISAGVVMNVLLGGLLFVIVYMHGLEEKPGEIAYVEPGGAAWRAGIHSGTEIRRLGSRENPWFDDIRPIVWATHKGEELELALARNGREWTQKVEPLLEEGAAFPVLGIAPPESLTLDKNRQGDPAHLRPGSPAAAAVGADGKGFLPGDRVVAASDPDAANAAVTPLPESGGVYEYSRRMSRLAGRPVTLHVRRADAPADAPPVPVEVKPAFRNDTGLRLRIGQVTAVRDGVTGVQPGDRIVEVEVRDGDGAVVYSADPAPRPGKAVRPLDPLTLPGELNRWADRTHPERRAVTVTVLRSADHTEKRMPPVTLAWDQDARFDVTYGSSANTPLPVNGLGLAYRVQTVVDAVRPGSPAEKAGVRPNDTVTAVRFTMRDADGKETPGYWEDVKPHQGAGLDGGFQAFGFVSAEVKLTRDGQPLDPLVLTAAPDESAPLDYRGLLFAHEFRVQKAADIGEALRMGFYRTLRSINGIYLNLYAMVFGRMNPVQTLSGPITLARASYLLAGESVWRLLLMLALISINLAVVNFLPIPVLDGGHMMFLAYEGVRGKPAPERVQTYLTIFGLVCVGCLMLFVVGLDIYRLGKMWLMRM